MFNSNYYMHTHTDYCVSMHIYTVQVTIYTFTYMQLVRELSRVMENSIDTELLDIWTELAPRIVQLARQEREDNHFIDQLLSLHKDPSNGEYACIHCILDAVSTLILHVNCTLAVTL